MVNSEPAIAAAAIPDPQLPDAPTAPGRHQNPMVGIGLKVISVAVFLSMASFLKASGGIPTGQMVFFRSFFAIIPIVAFLAYRRELIEGVKTNKPMGHVWRGVVGVGGMSF